MERVGNYSNDNPRTNGEVIDKYSNKNLKGRG